MDSKEYNLRKYINLKIKQLQGEKIDRDEYVELRVKVGFTEGCDILMTIKHKFRENEYPEVQDRIELLEQTFKEYDVVVDKCVFRSSAVIPRTWTKWFVTTY